jgi:hypothetical protein
MWLFHSHYNNGRFFKFSMHLVCIFWCNNLEYEQYEPTLAENISILKVKYSSWSLTLREKHRLRVFENWVLRSDRRLEKTA